MDPAIQALFNTACCGGGDDGCISPSIDPASLNIDGDIVMTRAHGMLLASFVILGTPPFFISEFAQTVTNLFINGVLSVSGNIGYITATQISTNAVIGANPVNFTITNACGSYNFTDNLIITGP